MTKLTDLIKSNQIAEAIQLLDDPNHGIDLNAIDADSGLTALHYAAMKGSVELVDKLIEKGADKDCKGNFGDTPLHLAAWKGYTETVAKLIEKGADKDYKNNYGRTPLHLTAWHGHAQVVEKLLAQGANKDCKDNLGDTPLHLTAWEGFTEAVAKLIEKGADITAKNNFGRTALDIAKKEERHEVVKLLEAAEKQKLQKADLRSTTSTPPNLNQQEKQPNKHNEQPVNPRRKSNRLGLWLASIIGLLGTVGLIIGIGALAGWSVMVGLLSIAAWLPIAVTAVGGIALMGCALIYVESQLATQQQPETLILQQEDNKFLSVGKPEQTAASGSLLSLSYFSSLFSNCWNKATSASSQESTAYTKLD